jgi:hypothetical protein
MMFMYPNLKAECGKDNLCGVHPESLAKAANITLELFNAAINGGRALTHAEAQAIARGLNQCRAYATYVPLITEEYILSPTLTQFAALTESQKNELSMIQKEIWDFCDMRNFNYDSYSNPDQRALVEEMHARGRDRAARCMEIVARLLFQPISYAEYRNMCKEIGFVRGHLRTEREKEHAVARGIDDKLPAVTPPKLRKKPERPLPRPKRRLFPWIWKHSAERRR